MNGGGRKVLRLALDRVKGELPVLEVYLEPFQTSYRAFCENN